MPVFERVEDVKDAEVADDQTDSVGEVNNNEQEEN